MEKQSRSKGGSLMSQFSKGATFSVSNPPHSPGRRSEKGFSGPIVSIIPKEARHKKRSNSAGAVEPSSPKISCMGQIKPRKKKSLKIARGKEKAAMRKRRGRRLFFSCFKCFFRQKERTGGRPEKEAEKKVEKTEKKDKKWVSAVAPTPASRIGKMGRYKSRHEKLGDFDRKKAMVGNQDEEEEEIFIPHSAPMMMGGEGGSEPTPASKLGQMRRYQSGRETLGDFDWRKTMEAKPNEKEEEEEEEEEEVFIPHSAPIMMGGGGPPPPRPPSRLSKMTQYQSGREKLGDFDWKKTMQDNSGMAEADQKNISNPHSASSPASRKSTPPEQKKELNLWKRRDTAPPIPLQIRKN